MRQLTARLTALLASLVFAMILMFMTLSGMGDLARAATSNGGALSFVSSQFTFEPNVVGIFDELYDFNGDGNLDLFYTGPYSGYVNLWLGDGAGGFVDTYQYIWHMTMGLYPEDIDSDGDLDLLTVSYDWSEFPAVTFIRPYLNDGDGHFYAPDNGFFLGEVGQVLGLDVDADGDWDFLATTDSPVQTKLYLNEGVGQFSPAGVMFDAPLAYSSAAADVDGDGDLDLVSYADNGGVWLNNGAAQFPTRTQTFALDLGGYNLSRLIVGDFDKDMDTDFLANIDNEAWLMLNDGSGRFYTGTTLIEGPQFRSLSLHDAADLDNDGDLDIVITDQDEAFTRIYINDGTGDFTLDQTLPTGNSISVVAGDLDNDNDQDLVISAYLFGQPGGSGRAVWLNNEAVAPIVSPTIQRLDAGAVPAGRRIRLQASAVQGDNISVTWRVSNCPYYRGLVITTCALSAGPNTATVTMSNEINTITATYHFTVPASVPFGGQISVAQPRLFANEPITFSLYVAGGERRELYWGDGTWQYSSFPTATHIYTTPGTYELELFILGPGSTSSSITKTITVAPAYFVASPQMLDGNGAFKALPADYDNDGTTDILMAGMISTALNVWLNPAGTGDLLNTRQYLEHGYAADMASGDIDGDGDIDLVTAGPANNLFLNNGAGYFYLAPTQLPDQFAQYVTLIDLDDDGDLDILYTFDDDGSPGEILWNDGAGQFVGPAEQFGPAGVSAVAVGDLNGDTATDLVISSWLSGTRIWLNDGDGVPALMTQTLPTAVAAQIADTDGDLVPDLVLAQDNRQFGLWLNDGNGQFALQAEVAGYQGSWLFDFAVSDFDNNGLADLAVPVPAALDPAGGYTEIWLNQGGGNFVLGDSLVGGLTYKVASAHLNSDTLPDLVLAIGPMFPGGRPLWFNNGQVAPITGLAIVQNSPFHVSQWPQFSYELNSGNDYTATWSFGDGQTSRAFEPWHHFSAPGAYTVALTLTNALGSSRAETQILVIEGVTPTATLVYPRYAPSLVPVSFTATFSGDDYVLWLFGDGTAGFENTLNHVYAEPGVYTVTLLTEATWDQPAQSRITITGDSLAGLTITASGPFQVGAPITFTASLTSGTPFSYSWSMGDGTVLAGPVVSHTFTAYGVYTVSVTVADQQSSLTAAIQLGEFYRMYLPMIVAAPPPD